MIIKNNMMQIAYESQEEMAAHLPKMIRDGFVATAIHSKKKDKLHPIVDYIKQEIIHEQEVSRL